MTPYRRTWFRERVKRVMPSASCFLQRVSGVVVRRCQLKNVTKVLPGWLPSLTRRLESWELFPTICHPKKKAYLIAFAETGNKVQAAKAAGVSHATVYSPPWKADAAFQEGLVVAKELATDVLEGEAFKRAAFGVRKPAGWYKGKPGGYVREYSDILTIFLLKGLRPEKYRDRVELRGALANIDISYLPDHLLQRVADGEHILSVLASAVELGAAGGVDVQKLLGSGGAGAGAGSAGEIVVEEIEGDGEERARDVGPLVDYWRAFGRKPSRN